MYVSSRKRSVGNPSNMQTFTQIAYWRCAETHCKVLFTVSMTTGICGILSSTQHPLVKSIRALVLIESAIKTTGSMVNRYHQGEDCQEGMASQHLQ